jgi:hypothetical protein
MIKKAEDHAHIVALQFMHYNYCKIHPTTRIAPSMAPTMANHVWKTEELVAFLD